MFSVSYACCFPVVSKDAADVMAATVLNSLAHTCAGHAGLERGAVTPLALVADKAHAVTLVLDQAMLVAGETEQLLYDIGLLRDTDST